MGTCLRVFVALVERLPLFVHYLDTLNGTLLPLVA